MIKGKISTLLSSVPFWLFIFVTLSVFIKLIFFPQGLDILELGLILLWRYSLKKVKYHTGVFLCAVFLLVTLMPLMLLANQTELAGGLAIWVFYLLIVELVLSLRSVQKKE